ncbi:MAG: DUF427 domain-containing protein [Dehalococcoidales bacterium]
MARATWNGTVIAESDDYEVVEGNVYFPAESVHTEYLRDGDRQYTCPWKGESAYHDIVVGDEVNRNAAWSYPEPKEAAANIKGHVAFGGGVAVER